jgi:3-deoxy-D-manno-octulosonate 8-phosphate phosphatase (KDO 8-P phosphatase)
MPITLEERIQKVRFLILDVDGVLSDGRITYSDSGEELKSFHVRDGSAIKFWREAGNGVAIISGRRSSAVERRAKELGIETVLQGQSDKLEALRRLQSETQLDLSETVAMGDDLPDLPVLQSCAIGIAVADACAELREAADWMTSLPGGAGAVREAIEWLLKRQGRWQVVVDSFRING